MIISPNDDDDHKHGLMMISVMIMTHDSLRNDKARHALTPNYSSIAEMKWMRSLITSRDLNIIEVMMMRTMYNRSDDGNDNADVDNY